MHQSLTRSIAEYSTPVWSPQHSNELTQLESIQRGMTRFVSLMAAVTRTGVLT